MRVPGSVVMNQALMVDACAVEMAIFFRYPISSEPVISQPGSRSPRVQTVQAEPRYGRNPR